MASLLIVPDNTPIKGMEFRELIQTLNEFPDIARGLIDFSFEIAAPTVFSNQIRAGFLHLFKLFCATLFSALFRTQGKPVVRNNFVKMVGFFDQQPVGGSFYGGDLNAHTFAL